MTYKLYDRIEVNPKISSGKPVIAGTRIAVGFIIQLLANGWTINQIMKGYPNLKKDDVLACLEYARQTIETQSFLPLGSSPSLQVAQT